MNMTSPRVGGASDLEILQGLFHAEVANVHGFVLARTGSTTIAEDVTGDVFVEAARRFREGRGDEVTGGWLITVARRRLIDWWRRSESQRRRTELLRLERQPEEAMAPEDSRLLVAMSSLPDRQRAALSLRYLDEFSVSEVADALELSYQATESLLARARRSFRRAYGGER